MKRIKLLVEKFAKKSGITLQEVAERTGFSKSYITHIKNGSRRWNETTLLKLSEAFGVEPRELIGEVVGEDEIIPAIEAKSYKKVKLPVIDFMPREGKRHFFEIAQELSSGKHSEVLLPTDAAARYSFVWKDSDGSLYAVRPAESTEAGTGELAVVYCSEEDRYVVARRAGSVTYVPISNSGKRRIRISDKNLDKRIVAFAVRCASGSAIE